MRAPDRPWRTLVVPAGATVALLFVGVAVGRSMLNFAVGAEASTLAAMLLIALPGLLYWSTRLTVARVEWIQPAAGLLLYTLVVSGVGYAAFSFTIIAKQGRLLPDPWLQWAATKGTWVVCLTGFISIAVSARALLSRARAHQAEPPRR